MTALDKVGLRLSLSVAFSIKLLSKKYFFNVVQWTPANAPSVGQNYLIVLITFSIFDVGISGKTDSHALDVS